MKIGKRLRLLIFLFIVLFTTQTYAQPMQQRSKQDWEKLYNELEIQFNNNSISAQHYVKTIDSITEIFSISGLNYPTEDFTELLETFKITIWNDENSFQDYRANYFRFFMINALGSGRSGEALFFAEKNENEIRKSGKSSLLIPYIKLIIWAKSGNNEKVVQLYTKQRTHLISLIHNKMDSTNTTEYMQAMQFYYFVLKPLLKENKDNYAREVLENIIQLKQVVLPALTNSPLKNRFEVIAELQVKFCQIDYYTHYKSTKLVEAYIDTVTKIIYDAQSTLGHNKNQYENILNGLALNYYLEIQNNEKAAYYLDKLSRNPYVFDDEKSNFFKYRAHLLYNQKKFQDAYTLLDSAFISKNTELTTAYNEMSNLLYAHTESEYNKLELLQKDKEKKKQNNWIITISILSLIILIMALVLIKREKKRALKQIKTLNKMTDIVIQQTRQLTIQEEQKRLGQDLHDDLSASLISILHSIDFIQQKHTTTDLFSKDLEDLKQRTQLIYTSIRNKSHKLNNQVAEEHNQSFQQSVANIINTALQGSHYHKNIEIDPMVATTLNAQQRIELLRILNEAIANILKHSKANDVSVFLFRNNENFIFLISDNGVGINGNVAHKGIGLESIKSRAQSLGGYLQVMEDDGTSLAIYFPLQSHIT